MFRRFAYNIEKNFRLSRDFDSKKDITKNEIEIFLKNGAILIDVRSPQEFREGHIDRAISIPDYKIRREIENMIPNKNQLIILYCSTGHRSIKAQKILENLEYNNVYTLYEGFDI